MAIKKSDLYSSLWASCDALRGGMDASQYKDYVLFMLFIKYISDKYGDSDDFAPPVIIPKGASFKDMIALKGKSDIGDKINTQIIAPLVEANARLSKSDFPDFNDPNKLGEGKRRFKSDLLPATILVATYFAVERDAIAALDNQLATLEQQQSEMLEEQGGEDGLLAEVIEGEGDKQKIATKVLKARLKEIGKNKDDADERKVLEAYADLLEQQAEAKAKRKAAQEELDQKIDAKYPTLSEAEIKTLVVDDKWMARLQAAVQGELDRVSQTLTGRIRELAERYATPLPQLTDEVATLAARVDEHLKRMGAVWK